MTTFQDMINTASSKSKPQEKTKFWLNIGMKMKDGSIAYLPKGISLDELEVKLPNKLDTEYGEQMQRNKSFTEFVQQHAATIPEGEEAISENFVVSIRHAKSQEEVKSKVSTDEFSF